eukprot:Opistho-2@5016
MLFSGEAFNYLWLVSLSVSLLCTGVVASSSVDGEVHAFFYAWYGNPATDGVWKHWDHTVLPHWNEAVRERFVHGVRYVPPEDVGASFYPQRGPYSSQDAKVLDEQMRELKEAGVSVISLSWWGQLAKSASHDGEGITTDNVVIPIMDAAGRAGVRVNFHLEPYEGRNLRAVRSDIDYIVSNYGGHVAFYRTSDGLPMYYVYDSYHIATADWGRMLCKESDGGVRGSKLDGVFIGLALNAQSDLRGIERGCFDGVYTYFASAGFTEASDPANWDAIVHWANERGKISILSVGPGYDDTRIRPWNRVSTKSREDGAYYRRMWSSAIHAAPSIISITSYNEWGEGTQIEPCVPKEIASTISETGAPFAYAAYASPDQYMRITREMVARFVRAAAHRESCGSVSIAEEQEEHEEGDTRWHRDHMQDDL